MTRFILSILTLLACAASFGQTKNSIGLSLIGRYDQHADYVSNFAGRVYNDTNKLSGFSYGINGIIKRKIAKSTSVYLGLGYYQLRIDKIKGPIPYNLPGTRRARNINYPNTEFILYSTSQYHYNDLALTIGFEKVVLIKKGFSFDIAPEIVGYKTFSQRYKISNGSHYSAHNDKPLEFGINVKTGITKDFKNFYLQPSALIPVYQNLKGDKVFYEDNRMNISKWFHGIGASVTIGKYF